MIDGFKLTMSGDELRAHLAERVEAYHRKADRMRKDLKDPECPFPEEMINNEIERAEENAADFTFMRDHILVQETYLLGERDLRFAELIAEKDEQPYVPCVSFRR